MLEVIHFMIDHNSYYKSKKGRKRLAKWSVSVRKKANFKCSVCGSDKNTEAHHIELKYMHPKKAFKINNGVCLCRKCHRTSATSYHKVNGLKGGKGLFDKWVKLREKNI